MAIIKNPITIVQGGEEPTIAEPLVSWVGNSTPAILQTKSGHWFNTQATYAHGTPMVDKSTNLSFVPHNSQSFRIVMKSKCKLSELLNQDNSLFGASNGSYQYPRLQLATDGTAPHMYLDGRNTANVFAGGNIANVPNDEWFYSTIYWQEDSGFIVGCMYDKSGTILGAFAAPFDRNHNISGNNLVIGGAGYSNLMARNIYFDIDECFVENNDVVLWGAKNSKTQNMGIVRFDDISNFTLCEYIETTGTQFIDTLLPTKPSLRIVADMKYTEYPANNQKGMNGTMNDSINPKASLALGVLSESGINKWLFVVGNGYTSTEIDGADLQRHTFDVQNGSQKIDGTQVSTLSISNANDLTIPIGCGRYNRDPADFSKAQYFSVKAYDGGTLVRDYVPCYHTVTGIRGMFDLVNNKFYVNDGTGEFVKGADVN